MQTIEEVIQNKLILTENYKRVSDYIDTSGYTFDELTAFIIYDLECENIIEFINLTTPFICYISSLLKYEDIRRYKNNKMLIKLEFRKSEDEYILDILKINDENGIRSIRECVEYFNGDRYYLAFTKNFDGYFILYDDSDNNDDKNDNKTFKEDECLICFTRKPNALFCGCGHICMCEGCLEYYESYKCPICKNINKNIRII